MSDMSDNRINDPQQREDDLQMAGERVEPEGVEQSMSVTPEADDNPDAEGERTGVLGDPLDENIGEDTGMLE